MTLQDQMMENYNYWRDSRVQSRMFSYCWTIVWQEAHSAVVAFDEEFILERYYWSFLESIVDKWVADEEPFTLAYREKKAENERRKAVYEEAKAAMLEKYGVTKAWNLPPKESKEDCKSVNELFRAYNDYREYTDEYHKLYKRAEAENDQAEVLRSHEIGDFAHPINGNTYSFCMKLATVFEVCDQCRGSGKVVNPSIDAGGLSRERFDEDPDFEERYFAGAYDIQCPTCKGQRVVAKPVFPEPLAQWIKERDEDVWECIREECYERSMGL